jgi:hypothetical protein
MLRLIMAAVAASTLAVPSLADPAVRGWKTADSQGCMILRECTDKVVRITSTEQLEEILKYQNYHLVKDEANDIIAELEKMGVGVYLADDQYFLRGIAGVYTTAGNNIFLNESYVDDPYQYLETLRHEGMHAAQDAMAGTIDNNLIALIYPEEAVPRPIAVAANLAYGENNPGLPWEREGKWAGYTPNMTVEVLQIINRTDNKPWTEIEPTPLTRQWLEENGYIK